MSLAKPRRSRRPWGWWVLAALVWTLFVCYPDPAVLVRNLLRYRHFPVDPQLEKRTGWALPEKPDSIETFVDGVIVPTPDWRLYRVPWFMPAPSDVIQTLRGDCESKAVVLASLLAGKHIPYEIRASFNHIWVDYAGRRPRPGETRDIAYLDARDGGSFSIHFPSRADWRQALAVQKEQLWEEMPLARKALWLLGLAWLLALFAVARRGPREGAYLSDWRVPAGGYLSRASWLAAIVMAAVVAQPWLAGSRWSLADVWEALAFSVTAGAFIAWLTALRANRSASVDLDAGQVVVFWSLGRRRGQRRLTIADIAEIHVEGSPGGMRPWVVSAALRIGRRVPLVRYRSEAAARAVGRDLGSLLGKPIVVRADGGESRTAPDEVFQNLRERAARRLVLEDTARPRGCDLVVDDSDGRWLMRYPPTGRAWVYLLIMAGFPVLLSCLLTYMVLWRPLVMAFWAGWVIAAGFLGLSLYLALMLKGEVIARLAGVRVEIGDGELRFYTPERTIERVDLDQVESVEIGRLAETPTIAVVAPEKVIHLRDLFPREHRQWVRQEVERAILRAV
ncbi:MAG: hypothetical protein ABSD48_06565 [Armatimonadota bacterium]